ncbi:MAG: hypothetical protein AB7U98_01250 [Candidatus Nitrosocosmicus sp.]
MVQLDRGRQLTPPDGLTNYESSGMISHAIKIYHMKNITKLA